MARLGIVVPCYNEEQALDITNKELTCLLSKFIATGKIDEDSFLLYVDDGSKDGTWNKIIKSRIENNHVYGLKLSRNEGHQRALTAGMLIAKDYADMIITIDADLQDDTSVIEAMIEQYREGSDIVYGVRNRRDSDTVFKRVTALGFYRLMQWMKIDIVYNHADYRLLSKRALERFEEYGESNLFLRGLIPLLGYPTSEVRYDRKERVAGESKYPLQKMLSMAFDGITSFSIQPIKMIAKLGLVITIISILAAIYAFISYSTGKVVAGWTSLILSIWFIGGVQLLSVGLIGTYIGKIYIEVKHRPRYHIETNDLAELNDEKQ